MNCQKSGPAKAGPAGPAPTPMNMDYKSKAFMHPDLSLGRTLDRPVSHQGLLLKLIHTFHLQMERSIPNSHNDKNAISCSECPCIALY